MKTIIMLVLAVIAVLVLVCVLTFYRTGKDWPSSPDGPGAIADWLPTRLPTPHEASPRTYRADCTSPRDHDEADLCQQWRTAIATETAASLSKSQWWLTVWQIIITALATVFTAYAAFEAGRAATAAARSARIDEEAFRRLERPYLFVQIVDSRPLATRLPVVPPSIKYAVANFGKTPAVLRSFSIALEDSPGEPLLTPIGVSITDYEVIPPAAKTEDRIVFVTDANDDAFYRGANARLLVLHGVIEYDDAAGTTYQDQFCLRGNDGGRSFSLESGSQYNWRRIISSSTVQSPITPPDGV